MKDVIDVLQLQQEKARKVPNINYLSSQDQFHGLRFIFECGAKLGAQPLTISTACTLYHKFYKEGEHENYECYLVGITCLYLAGKMNEDVLKIRDAINVSYKTLHRNSAPLELGDVYWNTRDAIVQTELLIMRMLKFKVNFVSPHKYLLHYLKTLQGWMRDSEWKSAPIAKSAVAFLHDLHHDASVLDYKAQHLAVAAINLALQVYGVNVPLTDESDTNLWYSVFVADLPKDKLWEIMEKMMDCYERDTQLYSIS